jgi:hypothetical protein
MFGFPSMRLTRSCKPSRTERFNYSVRPFRAVDLMSTHQATYDRHTCDRSCEGFTTLVFIAPPAALGWWEFRLGSDRTQRPG